MACGIPQLPLRRRPRLNGRLRTGLVLLALIVLLAIFAPVIAHIVGHGPDTQYLQTGLTPHAFQRNLRVMRARAMLRVQGGRTQPVGAEGAVIGRSRDADVVLEDPNVSRHHAEVRPSGGSWIVNDLGSTNGIKVNGRRVHGPQSLKRGDVIEIGTSNLTFDLE